MREGGGARAAPLAHRPHSLIGAARTHSHTPRRRGGRPHHPSSTHTPPKRLPTPSKPIYLGGRDGGCFPAIRTPGRAGPRGAGGALARLLGGRPHPARLGDRLGGRLRLRLLLDALHLL